MSTNANDLLREAFAALAQEEADALETQIAREAAHQWFYAQVATDEYAQPWQDEALAEYAALRYVKNNYGQSGYETLKYYRVDMPM